MIDMHSSPVEALTQLRLEAIKLNVLFLELQGDIMRPLVDTNIKCLFEYSSNYKMLSQEMNQLVSSIESILNRSIFKIGKDRDFEFDEEGPWM